MALSFVRCSRLDSRTFAPGQTIPFTFHDTAMIVQFEDPDIFPNSTRTIDWIDKKGCDAG